VDVMDETTACEIGVRNSRRKGDIHD
jgi:hypothetical protein